MAGNLPPFLLLLLLLLLSSPLHANGKLDIVMRLPVDGSHFGHQDMVPLEIERIADKEEDDLSEVYTLMKIDGRVAYNTTGPTVSTTFFLYEETYVIEAVLMRNDKQVASRKATITVGETEDSPVVGSPMLDILMPRHHTRFVLQPNTTLPLRFFCHLATNGPIWKADTMDLLVTVSEKGGNGEEGETFPVASGTISLPYLTPHYRPLSIPLVGDISKPGTYIVEADVIRKDDEEVMVSSTSTFRVVHPIREPRHTPLVGVNHVYICHWAPLVDRYTAMQTTLARLGLDDSHVTWLTDFDRRTVTQAEIDAVYLYDADLHFERLQPFYPRDGQSRPPPLRKLSAPEALVTMCHLKIYDLMQRNNDHNAMVLEDDTCFYPDFLTQWPQYYAQTNRSFGLADDDNDDVHLQHQQQQQHSQFQHNFDFFFIGSGTDQHIKPTTPGKLVYTKQHPASRTAGSYVISLRAADLMLQTMVPFGLVSDGELDYQLWLHGMRVLWAEPNLSFEGTREGNHFQSVVQEGRSSSQHAAVITKEIAELGWYVLENVCSAAEIDVLRKGVVDTLGATSDGPTIILPDSMNGEVGEDLRAAVAVVLQTRLFQLGANASLDRFSHGGAVQICPQILMEANGERSFEAAPTVRSGDGNDRVVRAYLFLEGKDFRVGVMQGSHRQSSNSNSNAVGVSVAAGHVLLVDERLRRMYGQQNALSKSVASLQFVLAVAGEDSVCEALQPPNSQEATTSSSREWMESVLAPGGGLVVG